MIANIGTSVVIILGAALAIAAIMTIAQLQTRVSKLEDQVAELEGRGKP